MLQSRTENRVRSLWLAVTYVGVFLCSLTSVRPTRQLHQARCQGEVYGITHSGSQLQHWPIKRRFVSLLLALGMGRCATVLVGITKPPTMGISSLSCSGNEAELLQFAVSAQISPAQPARFPEIVSLSL